LFTDVLSSEDLNLALKNMRRIGLFILNMILFMNTQKVSGGELKFVKTITAPELNSVYDLALQNDDLWIPDYRNNQVLHFSQDKVVRSFPGLPNPHSVALDPEGNFYVTDLHGNMVSKFDPNGKRLLQFGSQGSGQGEFMGAVCVRVGKSGNIYVADYKNHRIQKFGPQGHFLKAWGKEGGNPGEFCLPHGLALDADENIYVADRKNGRIQVFDPEGSLIRMVNPKQLIEPLGVFVDDHRAIWVAEITHHSILKFSPEGNLLFSFGENGSNTGEFVTPTNVCADKKGQLYVTEEGNARIQVFQE